MSDDSPLPLSAVVFCLDCDGIDRLAFSPTASGHTRLWVQPNKAHTRVYDRVRIELCFELLTSPRPGTVLGRLDAVAMPEPSSQILPAGRAIPDNPREHTFCEGWAESIAPPAGFTLSF